MYANKDGQWVKEMISVATLCCLGMRHNVQAEVIGLGDQAVAREWPHSAALRDAVQGTS
jgi:hypothetical protein